MLSQTRAVIAMGLQSIPQRMGSSVATVLTIAIVVAVLLFFLAMAAGFRQTIGGSGAADVAIVLRGGSTGELSSSLSREQQLLLAEAPGVARADDEPLASGELYVVVDGRKKGGGSEINIPLRGLGPQGRALRGIAITAGRMFTPGTTEIVVGEKILDEFQGFDLGSRLRLGQDEWDIVGVFSADGSVFESELWADARTVQSLFNRGSNVQSVRLKLTRPEAISDIMAYADNDPRLEIEIQSEQEFFAAQAEGTAQLIESLGYPVAIAMALGALAGALNAMYTSVANRRREIATLRAIGFNGFSAFMGIITESLALAGLGGLLGAGAAYLLFDGITTSTLGGSFSQVVFTFNLSPLLFLNGLVLALAIGLVGGVFPAFRAARVPLVAAFRDET